MSKRIRLTARLAMNNKRVAESQEDGLFPGDVGNEERKKNYRKIDEYHTFKQTVNHELPDMRHDWQDNPRDEVGMGIPKTAKSTIVTATANATKLAYFLLGEKASNDMIEAQARDFLRLGSDRLNAAMERFAETADLYEEDDEDFEDEEDFEDDEVTAEMEEEEVPAVEEEVTAEEEVPAVEEETVVAEDLAVVADDEVTEEVPAVEEEPVAEISDEDVQVAPESVEAEEEVEEEDVDFDFGETTAEDEDNTPDELRSIFEETAEEEEVKASIPRTAKIQKIGGQPKVASALKADELSGLWDNDNGVF